MTGLHLIGLGMLLAIVTPVVGLWSPGVALLMVFVAGLLVVTGIAKDQRSCK